MEPQVLARVPLRRKVAIVETNRDLAYCWTENASESGVQVVAPFDAPRGRKFEALIHLPTSSHHRFIWARTTVQVVQVVYSGSLAAYRIGLHFITFEDEGRELFLQCLDEQMKRFGYLA